MTVCWRRGGIRGDASTASPAGVVVKLGGSLLTRRDWPEALANLLATITAPLLVVGGGVVVDGLRAIDAASPGAPALLHELAISAMSLTGRIVADALGLPVVATATATGGVLDAAAWLVAMRDTIDLPVGWEVTSDSIAAAVAAAEGRGLVLVKRVPPPPVADLASLAAAGWVDRHFPQAAATLTEIAWAAPG